MKLEFTGPLWADDFESEGCWVLLQDLPATVTQDDGTVIVITAPAAFITDFCTVPRMPLIYDLFGNIARKAGALHDFLYSQATHPRDWCDLVLKAALIAQGVSEIKAYEMWLAVRVKGGPHYGTKTLRMRPCAPPSSS